MRAIKDTFSPANASKRRRYHERRYAKRCTRCPKKAMKDAAVCWDCLLRLRSYRQQYHGYKAWRPGRAGRPPLTFEDA